MMGVLGIYEAWKNICRFMQKRVFYIGSDVYASKCQITVGDILSPAKEAKLSYERKCQEVVGVST